jgi:hypothetical protein
MPYKCMCCQPPKEYKNQPHLSRHETKNGFKRKRGRPATKKVPIEMNMPIYIVPGFSFGNPEFELCSQRLFRFPVKQVR